MTSHVLLLREPSYPLHSDPYHAQLSTKGYTPHSIPTLETQLLNLDDLAKAMSSSEDPFDGVIMTSSRSAEAWSAAMTAGSFKMDPYRYKWSGVPFYVVGAKTASELLELLPEECRPPNFQIKGAEESGTAEKLADFILDTVGDRRQRILYLSGDKNRDTLPAKLKAAKSQIELVTITVYTTCEDHFLAKEIEDYATQLRSGLSQTSRLRSFPNVQSEPEPYGVENIWIVFFAPSSSSYAIPYLKKYFRLPFLRCDNITPVDQLRRRALPVAIGPTTASYLKDIGLDVEIVATKPNAANLITAIETFRLNH